MKTKLLFFLAAMLAMGGSLFAQGQQGVASNPLGGDITATSTDCSTVQSCVWMRLPSNAGTATVTLAGTFSQTLLVELSGSSGNTWTTSATLSAVGITSYSVNGYTDIRVRASAFTSGRANVTINVGLQQVQSVVSGSGSGSTAAAWKDAGGVIIPYVATDAETHEESTWLYESGCIILTTLSKCWKVWHSAGWNTTGMTYAECPSLANGTPGLCTRLNNGALFSSVGTGALGGRSRGYVLHQGATYYMFICGANCTTMDMWSSATGGNDFVLVQAAIISIGGVGVWDHTQLFNPYVWVEGTTWKMIYTGLLTGSPYGLGYATCTSACTGGAATWTKDAGNPFITADSVALGGYGNADLHIINNTYWIWAHSSTTLATLLPSDIYSWNCGSAGQGAKPTTCTQSPLGVPAFGRQSTDEGGSTLVGQVADVAIIERTDLSPTKTFLFYEGDLDGSQQGGMEHLKVAVAEMSLATLVTTTQGRAPSRDNLSVNSLAVGCHAPPGLGMLSVCNSNTSVAFKANNPGCSTMYMAIGATSDEGGLFCNQYLVSGAPPTLARISTSLTAGRFQINPGTSNALGAVLIGHTNGSGTETFPLQGYFDTSGNSFIISPITAAGGTAPVLTGTGACATFSGQSGAWAGTFTCTGVTAASTVTMTWPTLTNGPGHGWFCTAQDKTTRANLLQQTSDTATTCVLTATSVTQNDVFVFEAHAY